MLMQKLRIVHVYKSFEVYNGLIEILTIMAANFDYSRFELGVCVNNYKENLHGKKFERFGGKIIDLHVKRGFGHNIRELAALYRFFKNYKPHIVQTHVLKANLYGTIAAKLAGVPVIINTEMTLKDTAPDVVSRIRDRLIHPFVSHMINSSDKFLATSGFIKSQWISRSNEKKVEVIYPPFNLEKYDVAVRTPRIENTKIGKRIGFVGRLSEEKNVKMLIDAMVEVVLKIPDVYCTIVGTGPQEKKLKDYCAELNLQKSIEFTGYIQNSFEALREMDIFVLPSRSEGCPIVILEAMAMGLPVVATRVGGNPELVVDGESGILVEHGNFSQMTDAIVKLIDNRERAREMGQNGRRRAFSLFHPSSFTSKLQDIYLNLYESKCSS